MLIALIRFIAFFIGGYVATAILLYDLLTFIWK